MQKIINSDKTEREEIKKALKDTLSKRTLKEKLSEEDKQKVIELLKKYKGKEIPNKEVRDLSDELDIKTDEVESFIYSLASKQVQGEEVVDKNEEKSDLAKQIEFGLKVEGEHLPTYNVLKKYFEDTGKFPPFSLMRKNIVFDHEREFPDYYLPWLKEMEEEMKKLKIDWKWKEYIKGGLGKKREDMPQINPEDIDEYINEFKDDGIKITEEKLKLSELKPTQNDIKEDKILDMIKNKYVWKGRKYIISKDGYLIDSHHSWALGLEIDPETEVNVLRIDLPIKKLIKESNNLKTTNNKDIDDNIIKAEDLPELLKNHILITNLQYQIIEQRGENGDLGDIEKAKKDLSRLQKKIIINKEGDKQTVWVKIQDLIKQKDKKNKLERINELIGSFKNGVEYYTRELRRRENSDFPDKEEIEKIKKLLHFNQVTLQGYIQSKEKMMGNVKEQIGGEKQLTKEDEKKEENKLTEKESNVLDKILNSEFQDSDGEDAIDRPVYSYSVSEGKSDNAILGSLQKKGLVKLSEVNLGKVNLGKKDVIEEMVAITKRGYDTLKESREKQQKGEKLFDKIKTYSKGQIIEHPLGFKKGDKVLFKNKGQEVEGTFIVARKDAVGDYVKVEYNGKVFVRMPDKIKAVEKNLTKEVKQEAVKKRLDESNPGIFDKVADLMKEKRKKKELENEKLIKEHFGKDIETQKKINKERESKYYTIIEEVSAHSKKKGAHTKRFVIQKDVKDIEKFMKEKYPKAEKISDKEYRTSGWIFPGKVIIKQQGKQFKMDVVEEAKVDKEIEKQKKINKEKEKRDKEVERRMKRGEREQRKMRRAGF